LRRSTIFVSTIPSRVRRTLDELDGGVLGVGHRPDGRDRVQDALDRGRLEGHDGDRGIDLAGDLVDLAVADRADVAQLLGQDQVGMGVLERVLVERVERRAAVDRVGDEAIDLAAGRAAEVVDAPREHRLADDLGRPVTLVGDADELVLEPEGADDLGCGRKERGDSHVTSVGRGGRGPRREPNLANAHPGTLIRRFGMAAEP
jgi:hypothetical protein